MKKITSSSWPSASAQLAANLPEQLNCEDGEGGVTKVTPFLFTKVNKNQAIKESKSFKTRPTE